MLKIKRTNGYYTNYIKIRISFLLLSFLTIVACNTVDPIQSLGYTWRAYERTVRWGDVTGAVHFLKEDAVTSARFPKNINELKVTGYDVIQKSINEDDMVAHQDVRIRFYNVNDLVEKSFTDKQEWLYDEKNNRWYLSSKLLSFPIH